MNNMNTLPVFIVNDDWDERYLVNEIWKDLDLKNPLLFLVARKNY
jgi:hypothetical protein